MDSADDANTAIIHIADVHFWRIVWNPWRQLNKRFLGNLNVAVRRRREFVLERAEPFADVVAEVGARLALLTGDFTSTSLDEEFVMARDFVQRLQQRGLDVALVPGNHDVYTFESRRKRRFERYFEEFVPAEGYPSRRGLPGGATLVLVPTARPNLISARGHVAPDAVARVRVWLEEMHDPVLAAGHYPLLDRTKQYQTAASHRLLNAEALRIALGASGRRVLYVCGHVHRFSFVQDADYPNLLHLSTGAFIRNDPRQGIQGEFSEIRLTGPAVHVRRHVFRQDRWTSCDIPPDSP